MEHNSQFGERVNVLGTSLGYGSDIIQATFIKGLPPRLQHFAYTTQGGLDELVSATSQVVDVQRKSENVRPVTETVTQNEMGKQSLRSKDAVKHEAKANRFASIICYRCKKPGHMAWQRDKCEAYQVKRDPANEEKGSGSGPGVV